VDLRHLRYFICLAEELHFGRAAQRLHMSQPPLSQQIRALEEELGARLFERTSRRVSLTRAGELFLVEARKILAQFEHAGNVARLAGDGRAGRLGVAFTASAPFVPQVANALYAFRKSCPGVELELHELGRDDQVARIDRDDLDIGIIRGIDPPRLPAGMTSRCLLQEEMVLALRKDHPLAQGGIDPSIADLEGVPFLLYATTSSADFNDHFFGLCEQAGFQPTISLEVASFASLLGLVAAGLGVTILAASLSRIQVDDVVLRPLSSQVSSRLWMIHKHRLSPSADRFRRTILISGGEEP